MPDSMLTLTEASQLTGTTSDALRAAIHDGRLLAVKRGSIWFVERAEVERYIAGRPAWLNQRIAQNR